MRIAIINRHHSTTIGGSELQADLIGREFLRQGHHVTYLAVGGKDARDQSPYEVIDIDLWPPNLVRVLERVKPDIIYWRHNKNHLLRTALTARWLGIPLIFSCAHDTDVHHFSSTIAEDSPIAFRRTKTTAQRAINALNYQGFQLVSGAVAQTEYQLQRLPVEEKVLIRNSYAPDTEAFCWPRRFIAWVGTIKQRKRPELFVELAARCREVPADFLMVGRIADPSYTWIAEESDKNLPNFHYLGERTPRETNGIIGSSQFVVHTSDAEGFSNVLIQAWMNHKPTLTVSVDPDELIKRYEMGQKCIDVETLVRNTQKLTGDPSRITFYGTNARKKARELFDREQNVEQLLRFFQEILQRPDVSARTGVPVS